MRDIVPGPIIDAIQRYLQSRCQVTQLSFAEMESGEESITESLGKRLQTTRSLNRRLAIDNRIWRWRVCVSNFFDNSEVATEPGLAADGLLQIEVEDHDTGRLCGMDFFSQRGIASTATT